MIQEPTAVHLDVLEASAGGDLWSTGDGDTFTNLPGNTPPPAPVDADMIDAMLDAGWLRGGGSDADGSFCPLELTEAGEAVLEGHRPGRLAARQLKWDQACGFVFFRFIPAVWPHTSMIDIRGSVTATVRYPSLCGNLHP